MSAVMLIYQDKVSLSTYISSSSPLFRAFFAMHWKASSTLIPSLADVSKYGIFPFDAHQALAFFSETWRMKNKMHASNMQDNITAS